MHPARKVSATMTAAPYSVVAESSVSEAHQRMRELGLQQIPVLADGQPWGVLYERDLHLARHLGADLTALSVRALIPHESFSVTPDESLASAVRAMASRAASCAVVVAGHEVQGVLSATDTMRTLAELLEAEQAAQRRDEHAQIECSTLDESCLLWRAEERARHILREQAADDVSVRELRDAVKALYEAQLAHLEAEARALACTERDESALRRNRLEQLYREHKQHAELLEGVLMGLDDLAQPASQVAASAQRAVEALRADLEQKRDPLRFVS